jgi:hypothetical protein
MARVLNVRSATAHQTSTVAPIARK